MEHWGWSKNWVRDGLSNGAHDASTGDGTTLTKGIDSLGLEEATRMPLAYFTNVTDRANAGFPAPAKLETEERLMRL